jgi:hypothetical protein
VPKSGYIEFCHEIEKVVRSKFRPVLEAVDAEEAAITNPPLYLSGKGKQKKLLNWQLERELRFKWNVPTRRLDILQYCILSWYLPFRHRFEVQEALGQLCRQNLMNFTLLVLLEDKDLMLQALYSGLIVSHRELFGSVLKGYILKKVPRSSEERQGNYSIRIKVPIKITINWELPKKPRRTQRKRGYDDHGSLLPQDRKAVREANSTNRSELHNEISINRLKARIELLNLKLRIRNLGLP